ncbi:MAG: hypothetical protein GKS05_06005 [Nitrospirales bacterium]|nr:hypothetical protein [Nitrospirales bacterium]
MSVQAQALCLFIILSGGVLTGCVAMQQGWTEEMRQTYYHAPQGAKLLPYAWFLALEQATNAQAFLSDEHVRKFGIIPDQNMLKNPDRLPVGFAKTFDQILQETWVGFTCAVCHTGEFFYQDHTIRIDGAPAMLDALTLPRAIEQAVGATLANPEKFDRFAKAVLGGDENATTRQRLVQSVTAYLQNLQAIKQIDEQHKTYPIQWGFGRLDALGRGGNSVLTKLDPRNLRPADAPVSFPALWNAWTFEWMQWNGAITQPMGRNLGQAIGVNATLVLEPGENQFATSVNVKELAAIEELIQQLEPPVWPSEIFGTIDQKKVKRGAKLYEEQCAHCHVPEMTTPNQHGRQFKRVNLIPLEEIGTDPLSATNFHDRMVETGPLGLGVKTAAEATQHLTSNIRNRQYHELKLSKEQQRSWDGYRPNLWRAPLAYIARPHSAVWALAPYLHNGSVPNLYQLLSPREERDAVFYVGSAKFDPKYVGFVSRKWLIAYFSLIHVFQGTQMWVMNFEMDRRPTGPLDLLYPNGNVGT